MSHMKVEIGKTYDRLTVIGKDEERSKKTGKTFWFCKCNCKEENPNIVSVYGYYLRKHKIKSCGCLRSEKTSEKSLNPMVHLLYLRWRTMRRRCNDKNVKHYELYGGRGITYCERWEDFEIFKKDMYDSFIEHVEKYGEKDTTLDRIDVNGDYEPSNCRWATQIEQANNRNNNKLLTYNGETHTMSEWANLLGFTRSTIPHRLKRGWSVDRTLSTPMKQITYSKRSNNYVR